MAQNSPEKRKSPGSAFLAFLAGLVMGVLISAGVAFYVTHMPSPFVERGAQSSDAPEKPIVTVPAVSSQGLMNPTPVTPGSSPPQEAPVAQVPFTPPQATAPGTPASNAPASAPPVMSTAPQPPQGADGQSAPRPPAQTIWFIQTGAFGKASEAENQRGQLALVGVDATVLSPTTSDGKALYRVRIGPLTSQDEVRTLVATLKNNGFSVSITKSTEPSPSR